MHSSVLGFFVSVFRRDDIEGKKVLEVGSADFNGGVREIVQAYNPLSYLGIDAADGPGVDMVLDCQQITNVLGPDCADVVISTEMLEHVADWQTCIAQLFLAVKPGGLIVLTTRSIPFPYHAHPYDHWRYEPKSMVQILNAAGFENLIVCMDPDRDMPGVFVKARKPRDWEWPEFLTPAEIFAGVQGVTPVVKPLQLLGLPFAPDGSGYYRMYLPLKFVSMESGHRVYTRPPGSQATPTANDLDRIDALVMQRPMGGEGRRLWNLWKTRTKIIYECDDDVLRVVPSGLPHLLDENMRSTAIDCLRISDMVTVSTEPLAEQFRKYNDNVVVLPNYVNGELLDMKRPRRDKLTIGWAGGASHLIDWASVQDTVKTTLAGHPEIDLHFIGHDWSPLLGRESRFTPWSPNVWDYYAHIDFDIGLAPLASNGFNDCKSYIRCLEYGALGIPVVASNEPPYRDFVSHGKTGLLCVTESDWRRAIRDLINDADMREEMGKAAKLHAANYTIQEHWREWSSAYERVVSNGT